MCGIAGRWILPGHDADPAVEVARMRAALQHRGPDSHGLWRDDGAQLALGHARLAIVDLSEQGHQPMLSRSARYVLVFNGEIYNHLALRADLGTDVAWRGHSDTETLLEGVERWGLEAALRRCVGMFALALWDRRTRSLHLARDRMGEKPLYYFCGRHGVGFASELKALQRVEGLELEIDRGAIGEYLQYGYIGGARSVYRGITRLEPGLLTSFAAPDRPGSTTRFWSLPAPKPAASPAVEERVARFGHLLADSVRGQMLSDVPLGAFLSGGIDSSLVVAAMQRESPRPVRTFSMGFGSEDDESLQARDIASRLGTEHTELSVSPRDVLDAVPRMTGIYDEPFADSSQVPMWLLSRLTRRHVTVALSGDGGDELFGGYNRHVAGHLLETSFGRWPRGARRALAAGLTALPATSWDALAGAARRIRGRRVAPALGEKLHRMAGMLRADDPREAYIAAASQWLEPSGLPFMEAASRPLPRRLAGVPLAQQMMWWDLQTYLPDDILVKVDRAAMACSLETRVPLLDHRIVEFALETPLEFKIRHGRSKWLMRELLARDLPRELFDRPKQGFTVPIGEWLRGPLRDWAEALLDPGALASEGLLEGPAVRRIWKEHLDGQRDHQRALWTVLMLQAWLRGRAVVPRATPTCAASG